MPPSPAPTRITSSPTRTMCSCRFGPSGVVESTSTRSPSRPRPRGMNPFLRAAFVLRSFAISRITPITMTKPTTPRTSPPPTSSPTCGVPSPEGFVFARSLNCLFVSASALAGSASSSASAIGSARRTPASAPSR